MVAALERHLAQQELERDDIETLIDHRSRFVAARVENPQEQGTVVSMKQLLKLRAKREQVVKRIEELYKLVLQVHARNHYHDSNNRTRSCTSNHQDDIEQDEVNAHLLEHVAGKEDGNDDRVIAAPERNHLEYCSPDNYLDKIQAILAVPPPLLTSNLLNDHQYLMEQAKKCRDTIPKRQQTPRTA